MRILQLAPLYQPVRDGMDYGGIERMVRLLAGALTAAGHQVVTVARAGSRVAGRLVAVDAADGYEAQVKAAAGLASVSAFDVIQVHRREFFTLGGAALVKRELPGTRVVATLHGPPEAVRRHYGAFGPLASFVFVSQAQAAGVPGLAGTVILNAADTGRAPFSAAAASPPYLAFVGRVSRKKGVAEAAGAARAAGLPLRIAGVVLDGDREYFESAVAPLLRPGQAEFLGPVRDEAKYRLLGGAAATVLLPGHEDPCPVVAIEALASGTPVLAPARGGLPELVDDSLTGLVNGSVPGLTGRLPGLAGISRLRCRQTAVTRFGAARLARDYLAVYGA